MNSVDTLWGLLKSPTVNGKEIIAELSKNQKLHELFKADAGVWEGFSIEEHTLRVFENLASQYAAYDKKFKFQPLASVRLWELLKFTVALHDIGKPIAIAKGDKRMQHEFTLSILEEQLRIFEFNSKEIDLALALVGHDGIGQLLKERCSFQETVSILKVAAAKAGMPLQTYYPIQAMFYSVDAAAYPSLRQRIFTVTPEGLLRPTHAVYDDLMATTLASRD